MQDKLEQYNQINSEDEQESKYSIYYDIINEMYETADKDSLMPDVKESLTQFLEKKKSLISVKDFRH